MSQGFYCSTVSGDSVVVVTGNTTSLTTKTFQQNLDTKLNVEAGVSTTVTGLNNMAACAFSNPSTLYVYSNGDGIYQMNLSSLIKTDSPIFDNMERMNGGLTMIAYNDGDKGDCVGMFTSETDFLVTCTYNTSIKLQGDGTSLATVHENGRMIALWSSSQVLQYNTQNLSNSTKPTIFDLQGINSGFEGVTALHPDSQPNGALLWTDTTSKLFYVNLSQQESGSQVTNVNTLEVKDVSSNTVQQAVPVSGPRGVVYFVDSSGYGNTATIVSESVFTGEESIATPSLDVPGQVPRATDSSNGGDNGADNQSPGSSSSSKAGAIAGGAIGAVAVIIIAGILWWLWRRRKSASKGEKLSTRSEYHKQEIVPLLVKSDVKKVDRTPEELSNLGPSASGGNTVFKNGYILDQQLAEFPPENDYRIPGYATRAITISGVAGTLHYFPAKSDKAYLRTVNAVKTLQHGTEPSRIVKHYDAIEISPPTNDAQRYKYFWITSPCDTSKSLYSVVTGRSPEFTLDTSDYAFKAWSIYSLLESVQLVHEKNIVHLGLTPHCFFIDPDTLSDWALSGFDQAHSTTESSARVTLNAYSAPEIFPVKDRNNNVTEKQPFKPTPASDIFSLGCVIYFIAVGRPIFESLDALKDIMLNQRSRYSNELSRALQDADKVHESFRGLLEKMLIADPKNRSKAKELVEYWRETAGLQDDEDEADANN